MRMTEDRKISNRSLALVLLWLLAFTNSCAPRANSDRQATVQALSARVAQTSTAAAEKDQQSTEPASTAQVKATEVVEAQVATQTVQSGNDSAAQQATRAAEQPILAELPVYGVDPEK